MRFSNIWTSMQTVHEVLNSHYNICIKTSCAHQKLLVPAKVAFRKHSTPHIGATKKIRFSAISRWILKNCSQWITYFSFNNVCIFRACCFFPSKHSSARADGRVHCGNVTSEHFGQLSGLNFTLIFHLLKYPKHSHGFTLSAINKLKNKPKYHFQKQLAF